MPTLFRLLVVLGVIGGVIAGSLYVLAEYFQPVPKEISKGLRNVKARVPEDDTGSTTRPDTAVPAPTPSDTTAGGADPTP